MVKKSLFKFKLFRRLILHERRSVSVSVIAGTTARPPHVGASRLGAELPATRHSRADFGAAAQAARQSRAKQHEVFCDCRCFGNCQRSFLACKSHEYNQPALAASEQPQKKPFCGLAAEWSRFTCPFDFPLIRPRGLQSCRRLRFVVFQ